MQDRVYLLSLQEAKKEDMEKLWERLDAERRRKAADSLHKRRQLESAAAGLLLQYAVQTAEKGREAVSFFAEKLTLSDLLKRTGEALDLQYRYGPGGKPYLTNYPYFFSLSHSEDYVMCAISEREVGADIQKMRTCDVMKPAERFFSERERERLRSCSDEAKQRELFYELWTCKEAYGKLTGKGLTDAIGLDMTDCIGCETAVFSIKGTDIVIKRKKVSKEYKAAVCSPIL